MTAALAAAAIVLGMWIVVADPSVRVTVTNRTSESYDTLLLRTDEEPPIRFALAPGESRSFRLGPPKDPGRVETSVSFDVQNRKSGVGVGFGACRWAAIVIEKVPRDAAGKDRKVHTSHGTAWTWSRILAHLRAGQWPRNIAPEVVFSSLDR